MVLAALLSRPGQDMSTDWLIEAVWGEHPPGTARKTLQVYVSRLRALLGHDAISATASGYVLPVAPDDLDSLRFEHLVQRAVDLLSTEPDVAGTLLREGLTLWRGRPFADLSETAPVAVECRRLEQLRERATTARIEADLALGYGPELVPEVTDLVAERPLDEALRAHLMLALYRADRQAEALAVFEETRGILRTQLGIDPGDRICRLHEQILRHDDVLLPQAPSSGTDAKPTRNPYKGLRAFGPADAADFYGRADLVDEIIEHVDDQRLVLVVGASGNGKSSAVLAGVLPRLDERVDASIVVTAHVGSQPDESIMAALHDVAGIDLSGVLHGDDLDLVRAVHEVTSSTRRRLLLVIDQLEELFDPAVEDGARARVLATLAEAVADPSTPLTVLATLRADYLDRLLALWPDPAPLGGCIVTALPLAPADLARAATGPAERVGAHVTPELTAELVGDMARQPGALPLFEYALTEVFQACTPGVLTRSGYRSIGGLQGALSRGAEQVYRHLSPDAAEAARQVFLRLVSVRPREPATPRRASHRELASLDVPAAALDEVLGAFDSARLLTFDRDAGTGDGTVALAHEALLNHWPRLQVWVDSTRDDLRLESELATEVAQWNAAGRDDDYLITGSRLSRFDDWPSPGSVAPTEDEGAYLRASRERRAARVGADRRRVRRLRALAAGVSALAVLVAAVAGVAVDRGRAAAASERDARARELAVEASSAVEHDPELGVLLALESGDVTRGPDGFVLPQAQTALHAALMAHRQLGQSTGHTHVDFVTDDSLMVAGSPSRLLDPRTGADATSLPDLPSGAPTRSVAASDDGSLLITGSDSRDVVVWDARTGAEVRRLASSVTCGAGCAVAAVALSPDRSMAAALLPWGEGLLLWDAATGEQRARSAGPRAWPPDTCCYPVSLQFSPDGTRVVANWYDDARVMDVATGEWAQVLQHESIVTAAAYLPDGETLLTSSMDGTLRSWDAITGEPRTAVPVGRGQLTSMTISPTGDRLLTGDDSGRVTVWAWDGQAATHVSDLHGAQSWVYDVAISPDGSLGSAVDGTSRVTTWDITDAGPSEVAAWDAAGAVVYSHDGSRLLTTDPTTDSPMIVDPSSGTRQRALPGDLLDLAEVTMPPSEHGQGRLAGAAWSPDDSTVALVITNYGVVDDLLVLWDVQSGAIRRSFSVDAGLRGSVTFSGDGRLLAAATCSDGAPTATVWEAQTGRVVVEAPPGTCGTAVGLTKTGDQVAVQLIPLTDDAPSVLVMSTSTGDVLHEMTHLPTWRGSAAFSPDDTRLLTTGSNGVGRIWDVQSGDIVMSLQGHAGAVEHAEWSRDGTRVVTSGHDGSARLWDAATGETTTVIGAHNGFPYVSLSPDGRRLATGDGSVRIWTLDVDELVELAQTRARRPLTAAECATYRVDRCTRTTG